MSNQAEQSLQALVTFTDGIRLDGYGLSEFLIISGIRGNIPVSELRTVVRDDLLTREHTDSFIRADEGQGIIHLPHPLYMALSRERNPVFDVEIHGLFDDVEGFSGRSAEDHLRGNICGGIVKPIGKDVSIFGSRWEIVILPVSAKRLDMRFIVREIESGECGVESGVGHGVREESSVLSVRSHLRLQCFDLAFIFLFRIRPIQNVVLLVPDPHTKETVVAIRAIVKVFAISTGRAVGRILHIVEIAGLADKEEELSIHDPRGIKAIAIVVSADRIRARLALLHKVHIVAILAVRREISKQILAVQIHRGTMDRLSTDLFIEERLELRELLVGAQIDLLHLLLVFVLRILPIEDRISRVPLIPAHEAIAAIPAIIQECRIPAIRRIRGKEDMVAIPAIQETVRLRAIEAEDEIAGILASDIPIAIVEILPFKHRNGKEAILAAPSIIAIIAVLVIEPEHVGSRDLFLQSLELIEKGAGHIDRGRIRSPGIPGEILRLIDRESRVFRVIRDDRLSGEIALPLVPLPYRGPEGKHILKIAVRAAEILIRIEFRKELAFDPCSLERYPAAPAERGIVSSIGHVLIGL